MADDPVEAASLPTPRLCLFGRSRVEDASGRVLARFADSLPTWLLACLIAEDRGVGREALAMRVWPDRSEAEALRNLRTNLHRVRGLLAETGLGDALQASRHRVELTLASDLAEFRQAVGRVDWERAAALQPGPFADSLSFRGFPILQAWAEDLRASLDTAWQRAVVQHARTLDPPAAARFLLAGSLRGPRESLVAPLLQACPAAGLEAEALEVYDALCRDLQRTLESEPDAATLALARDLRRGPARPRRERAGGLRPVPRGIDQPPELIGRDRERAAVADAAQRLMLIVGDPGMGKTRLLEDGAARARWIAGREALTGVPYGPLIACVQDLTDTLHISPSHRRTLARLVPALDTPTTPGEAPPASAQLLDEAFLAVLATGVDTWVVDDLQWIDDSTLGVLRRAVWRTPLRLRLAQRTGESRPAIDDWLDSLDLRRLQLAPLSADAATQLVRRLSHSDEAPSRFGAWLQERSGGNVLLMLSTLRALFESGRLEAHGDGWSSALDALGHRYEEFELPGSVTSLIARRLDALTEPAQRLVRTVALYGAPLDSERLGRAAGLDRWQAAEALAAAERTGLLTAGRPAHDVIRQGIVAATPTPLRQLLQRGLVEACADHVPPAMLVEHAWGGGMRAEAIDLAWRAANKEGFAGLQALAVTRIEQLFARLDATPVDDGDIVDPRERDGVRTLLARMLSALGRHAEAECVALQVADAPVLPAWRAQAHAVVAKSRLLQGRVAEGAAAARAALAFDPDALWVAEVNAMVAQVEGRPADGIPILARRVAALRRLPPGDELLVCMVSLGSLHVEIGELGPAIELLEEARSNAAELQATRYEVEAACNLASAYGGAGRFDEAVQVARAALALDPCDATPRLRNNLAWALRELGRHEEAAAEYRQLADDAEPLLRILAMARLADIDAAAGRPTEAALDALLQALSHTEQYHAHAVAAEVVLRHGSESQVDAACTWLRPQALEPVLGARLRGALSARGRDPSIVP